MLSVANIYSLLQWQYAAALVVSVIILGFIYWYKRPANFPPGPRGIPLLGAIPFMGNYPERAIKKWSKSFGPVMAIRFGTRDMVVLNDYDSVQQVGDNLLSRLGLIS